MNPPQLIRFEQILPDSRVFCECYGKKRSESDPRGGHLKIGSHSVIDQICDSLAAHRDIVISPDW